MTLVELLKKEKENIMLYIIYISILLILLYYLELSVNHRYLIISLILSIYYSCNSLRGYESARARECESARVRE